MKPIFILILLALFTVFGFNNCGKFEAVYDEEGNLVFQSQTGSSNAITIDENQPIFSLQPIESVGANKTISFGVNPNDWPQGSLFVWDHKLGMQEVYCEQVTETNTSVVHLNCPESGNLVLDLMVVLPDMQEERYMVSLQVLDEGEVPNPGEGPQEPGPNPNPIDGESLWLTNCAGCHAGGKPGRNAMQIQNAINNNTGGMGFLNFLSADEVDAIAQYLQ
ncbi:MAG: cytochrome c [Bdellovibrionales bacterium]|nr:cytochrome c [Bdellovibrionales bacterium]